MPRISSALVALTALACQVTALPQGTPSFTCQLPKDIYAVSSVSAPYDGAPQLVNGRYCVSSAQEGCEKGTGLETTVGVSQGISIGIGLNLGEILSAAIGYEYTWSIENTVTSSETSICPQPSTGSYSCGLQFTPKLVKTTGGVRHGDVDACPTDDPTFKDFAIEAPYAGPSGVEADGNGYGTFRACVAECADKPGTLDCDAVREVTAGSNGMPICPGSTASKLDFTPGWCTAHIIQRQRWQGFVGDKFKFDLVVFDHDKKSIYKQENKQVDAAGRISWPTKLPKELITRGGPGDDDTIHICYGDQCFGCDAGDQCSLGSYDNNKREGDFGFSC